ncbi:HAMP domain-containing sensor histidine kinase [Paenibacillus daejeonensis]|uniref:HAMP domain-containing sensor histidine kinase n=1 Tax=Paenibacillus daejeonensis TaxID=135193 RepID=UPI000371B7B5|nr:HAMP domain-containing sensor histidine kinase [Paenibacillus daejeonensis]
MKHWPLAIKIWFVFAALLLFLFLMVALALPSLLKSFFTEQTYAMIRDAQQQLNVVSEIFDQERGHIRFREEEGGVEIALSLPTDPEETNGDSGEQSIGKFESTGYVGGPAIGHLFMVEGKSFFLNQDRSLPESLTKRLEQEAAAQVKEVETNAIQVEGQTLFYSISKTLNGGSDVLISYAWAEYRNEMVGTMFRHLLLLLIALLLISSIPCIWLARYLSHPLTRMERQVNRMSEGNWHESFELGRRDEIGKLSRAFDEMRQRLLRQDETQQVLLQNISHELKTPVMIIRTYAQSIIDDIYPRGSLKGSVDTILQETDRLMERVYELLSLSRLQYVSAREAPHQWFNVDDVVRDTVERLRLRRPEIHWVVNPPSWRMRGNVDQWKIVFENLLDNQIRYARQQIAITAPVADAGERVIEIRNDGPQLDSALLKSLFEPYRMGAKGQFGLGLSIVRQLLSSYGTQIEVSNEQNGVIFRLVLPEEEIA